ncbi:MAG: GH116 family glycosyl hydrolase [Candidatus Omnitrophota bacterium]|nr:GH116 family glycosyl hydrolase [Candidatus Omnitrophota bacterium]
MKYTSRDNLKSGLHLGGLGTGTLQIFPDGTRGVFTGQNNWEHPLGQLHWFRPGSAGDFRAANPFAIYVEKKDRKTAKLLQTVSLAGCPTIKEIKFEGAFPIADLEFKDADLPIKIKLRAFSPFIKDDCKNSGLPCAVYAFKITNPTNSTAVVSLLASGINANADWNVGRFNEVISNGRLIGINFHKKNPRPSDETAGIVSLTTNCRKGKVSYFGEWPYAKEAFRGDLKDRRFDAWKYFSRDGTLPNTNTKQQAFGEFDEWMGALAVKFKLRPHQTKEIPIYYSWYMPKHYLGHMYQNWFKDSWEVAQYIDKNKNRLLKKTLKWQEALKNSGLPDWLKDALINNLYVYTAASWWTKKGDFALYENTVKWPLMDSLDVRYYGTIPLVLFFPELEKRTMEMFARAQRRDGRIPHDLGRRQIDCPSDGTTAGKPWKDLSTKFSLMVYRDYLWSKDEIFLKKMYPVVKKAMKWQFSTDKNKDCLPDNEGKDSTFDMWDFHGVNSYTSSVFLASLLATQKMAKKLGDHDFLKKCRRYFLKGREVFQKKLWNGKFYISGYENNFKVYPNSMVGQLNGQWYAHLLGLGYILPEQSVKKAVKSMLELNARASEFGAVNSVFPDGRIDHSSYHAENIWPGETYTLCCLAIYEGFVEEGLSLARKTWFHFTKNALNPWSQPDVIYAKDGRLGDGELYLRNLSIWGIPLALARVSRNNKNINLFLGKSKKKVYN